MNCRPTIGSPFRRRKAYGGLGRDKDGIGPKEITPRSKPADLIKIINRVFIIFQMRR
jgi:hypothetical protein